MIVGVPKEIKVHESRVAITPEGVSEFVHAGKIYYSAVAEAHGYASVQL